MPSGVARFAFKGSLHSRRSPTQALRRNISYYVVGVTKVAIQIT
ncbi:hypothetical protein BKA12_001423 [Neomicrococcus lactis]|uniref:Uncharacterized protein n=1 Tax=Neomicrococcus lactis TaxID=732241 RepID=A0A7W8YB75_9MICC|nr:hypothetical protein [Neomicrococcus lactis]